MKNQWTRDQLLIAFKLYCELPFGKLHSKNLEIIKYAEKIGRTPSALAMKLANIASLDPVIRDSGRKGLSGSSRTDRDMWEEMTFDWERFSKEVMEAEQSIGVTVDPQEEEETASYQGMNKTVTTQVRIGQAFFRKCVLSAYGYMCSISGLSIPQLLIASHIVPWRVDEHNRLNPYNGLCLSALHDKAFDAGWISVDSDFTILVSPLLKRFPNDKFLSSSLLFFEKKPLLLPEKFQPNPEFLDFHRKNIFKVA